MTATATHTESEPVHVPGFGEALFSDLGRNGEPALLRAKREEGYARYLEIPRPNPRDEDWRRTHPGLFPFEKLERLQTLGDAPADPGPWDEHFDVVVGSNLFGDILSDLGPACTGTIAIAPSANINPEKAFPSMFEPVHGSAPDIAGQGIANPIGTIWAGAMMIRHLGVPAMHDIILQAIEDVLRQGQNLTPDMGGTAGTVELGQAIVDAIQQN